MTGLRIAALLVTFVNVAQASPAFAQAPAAAPDAAPEPAAAPPEIPPPPPAPPPPSTSPAAAGPTLTLPRGKIDLTTPPPTPSVPRSYHVHNGFYARASVGFGTLTAHFDDDDASGLNLQGSGGALVGDVMIGGSPSDGVAVGGALLFEGSASIEFERGPLRADRSLSVGTIGAFIDGFPIANKGWHLGAMLGLARVTIEDSSIDGLRHTNGLGGAFWVGHDFWVGDEWSIGPMLRFSGALTNASEPTAHASTFGASLLFTALYH